MKLRANLWLRLATWLAALASIIGLLISFRPRDQSLTVVHGVLIGAAVVFFLFLIIWETQLWIAEKPKAFRDKNAINKYLLQWMKRGGRMVVFTRNMSWAQNEDLRSVLLQKSKESELTICLPERIPLADELEQAGAEVKTYDKLKHIPEARFTIINQDRADAQVAVGRQINDKHVIEEFSAGEHPAFSIANDLIRILRSIPKSYRTKS